MFLKRITNNTFPNLIWSSVIPFIMFLYLLYIGAINGRFSLTGIDGEYVYLLNGMSISAFQFDNVGFTDHPGTPFLVLTGIFIRITHLLFGNGSIVDDVIARPDFYLQNCLAFMLVLSTLVLIWGGKKILDKTGSFVALIFVQGTYFFSEIVLAMQIRFIVDRFLPLIAFVFSVYTVLYLYNNISEKKYAIISGIIMGFGFIAKFNFVVLAVIPPLIIHRRYWLRYVGYFLIAAVVSFLPVIDKFENAKNFILKLFFNKGVYGGGEKGILDIDGIRSTLNNLVEHGENFVWFFIMAIFAILSYLFLAKKNKQKNKKVFFLVGFLIASVGISLMASKNFKSYYLIPTLGLSGMVLLLVWQLLSDAFKVRPLFQKILAIVLITALTIPTIKDLNAGKQVRKQMKLARLETRKFIDDNLGTDNYWFMEPAWIAGPFEVNGLLWGISYIAGKNDFTANFMKFYPNILTFEGDNQPIKHFRTKDAKIDEIFGEDTPVYLFSTPGRRTTLMQQELANHAGALDLSVTFDTIFTNDINNDLIIKASFKQKSDSVTYVTNSAFNDMENEYPNWIQNSISTDLAYSGAKSSKIERGNQSSAVFVNDSIQLFTEKLNSILVTCKYYQTSTKNNTNLIVELVNTEEQRFWFPVSCTDYFSKLDTWDDFSYRLYIPEKYREATQLKIYFYNSSKKAVYLDDIRITIRGKEYLSSNLSNL